MQCHPLFLPRSPRPPNELNTLNPINQDLLIRLYIQSLRLASHI